MFPLVTGIILLYLIFSKARPISTPIGACLFIAYVGVHHPLLHVDVEGLFDTTPKEIEEAALSTGCTKCGARRHDCAANVKARTRRDGRARPS